MSELYRYAAFLSYSSKDEAFARRLHGALERFRIPRSLGRFDLAGKANRVYPVFRDREELPAGTLGEQLETALRASGALIVIGSAHAATSHWVDTEVRYFQSLGRGHRIFAIITDEPPAAPASGESPVGLLPAALRDGPTETLAADARASRDGFRNAWLKIVAGMISVNAGALQDRDRRQRRRSALLLAGGGIAALAIAATSVELSDLADSREEFTARAALLTQRGERAAALPFALAGLGGARPEATAMVDRLGARLALVAVLPAPKPSSQILLSPDGKTLATRSGNYELAIWDTTTGARRGPILSAEDAWFSDDSRHLVLFAQDHFEVVDAASGQVAAPATPVLVARDGDSVIVRGGVIVAQTGTDTIGVWDVHTGRSIATLETPDVEMPVDVSASGRHLMSCDGERNCALWDVAQQRKIAAYKSLYGTVTFSPDDRHWVNVTDEHDLTLADATTGATVRRFKSAGTTGAPVFSADGSRVVVASELGDALLLDVGTGAVVADLGRVDDRPDPVAISADGSRYTTTRPDATGALWDAHSGRKILGFDQKDTANKMMISPDGSRLVVQSFDQKTSLWNGITGAKVADLPFNGAIGSVTFAHSGTPFIVSTIDAGTSVWTNTGQLLAQLGSQSGLDHVISQDGRRIGALEGDGLVQLWDSSRPLATGDGEPLRRRICAANAGSTPAFRSHDRGGTDAVAAYLRGRPWKVCDWRGLDEPAGWLQALRYWGVKAHVMADYREGD